MTSKQRDLISRADFTAILNMKCSKLIPELCRFLMEHFDPVACVLDFGERGEIPVDVQSVVNVMAVPMGTHPVPYKQNIDATSSVLEMMGINNGKQPTLADVEKQLGRSYPADDAYLRKFIIFLVSSVFAPTTGIYVSPKCYPAVINIKAIQRLDWARFIIDILIKTANAKGNKNWFKACMPYLMLKACFRNKTVLFSADPSAIDMFIRCHAPEYPNEEKLVQYREAIINMCSAFEDGLSQFIRSFAPNQLKESTPDLHQAEEDVDNMSKHKRRRRITKVQHSYREVGNQKDVQVDQMEGERKVEVEANPTLNEAKSKKRKPDDRFIAVGRPKKKKMKVTVVSEDCHDEGTANISEEKASDGINVDITCNNVVAEDDQTLNNVEIEEDGTDEGTVNMFEENASDGHNIQNSGNNVLAEDDHKTLNNVQIEEHVKVNEEVFPIVSMETEVSLPHTNTVDALRILQVYGTRSQSSTETPQGHCTGEGIQGEQEDERSNGSAQLKTKTKKSVSFSDQGQVTPVARRPVTRSMSPLKSPGLKEDVINAASSPRSLTRFATAEARANASLTKVCNSPPSATNSVRSMSKNLAVELGNAETTPESEHQRKVRELAEDCLSFDLGFSPVEHTVLEHIVPEQTVPEQIVDVQQIEIVQKEQDSQVEEVIVISRNEDSGDSLDKIYASIEMPTSTKLGSASNCILDRTVRKAFECSPTHRLDHKDMIMFSVLQDLTPEIKKITRHYYLIVLNLTSERFEVMDSLRREGDKALMADARTIIGSIKHLWATNYSESRIDISKYKTVHITTPRQLTTYDCGYFMLKYIECWNGRRMAPINPSDMPALRKIFLKKWMDYVENMIDWEELLFPVRKC
ncbi:hypothetical protein ACQ4PT_021638 [Festuca glaucescens]